MISFGLTDIAYGAVRLSTIHFLPMIAPAHYAAFVGTFRRHPASVAMRS